MNLMITKYIITLLLIIFPLQILAQSDIRIQECKELFANRKYKEAKQKAEELISIAHKSDNHNLELIGTSLHLLATVSIGDNIDYSDKVNFLSTNLPRLDDTPNNYDAIILTNKSLGLYYQLITQDFPQAANHDFKALEYSRKAKDTRSEIDMLCNLSSLYFQKNDSTGISYTSEAYAKAKQDKYMPGLYRASVNISNYLFNQRRFKEALTYLKEGELIASDLNYVIEMQYLYSFLGDIYAALNNPIEAENNYKKSIIDLPQTSSYDKIYARLCYSIFLIQQKRYQESINHLNETRKLSKEWKVTTFEKEIALNLSYAYERLGEYNKALSEYKLFDSIKEIQLNTEKEKEFSILDLKYKVTEEKRKNAQQEVELLRKNKNLITLWFVIAFVIICAIFIYYLYRKTQIRYKQIVQTHLENLENERKLRTQLEQFHQQSNKPTRNESTKISSEIEQSKETSKYTRSALSEQKSHDLLNQLEKLMIEDKIYHDPELTIDKLAAILNTNRTYLSQVINESSKLSYSSFINNYRIKEAVELLSDINNTEPIKSISYSIGFNSPSNFFTLFKNKIGVSPSVFRENVQKLSKTN